MGKLPRFDLVSDKQNGGWKLENSKGQAVASFPTKAAATAGGVLESQVGTGSVRIHLENGRIQEERTFPRSADPRGSKG